LKNPNTKAAPPSESDSDAPPAAVFEKDPEPTEKDEETEEEKRERHMQSVEESARLASSGDETSPSRRARAGRGMAKQS